MSKCPIFMQYDDSERMVTSSRLPTNCTRNPLWVAWRWDLWLLLLWSPSTFPRKTDIYAWSIGCKNSDSLCLPSKAPLTLILWVRKATGDGWLSWRVDPGHLATPGPGTACLGSQEEGIYAPTLMSPSTVCEIPGCVQPWLDWTAWREVLLSLLKPLGWEGAN